jgi:hypothetical protein
VAQAKRRGFVLVALSLSILFLLGMVGLAIDVGRMYVVRNESQSFCDSAAMFAAKELNTVTQGVNPVLAALDKVTWVSQDPNGPLKRLEFNTRQFENVTTSFATDCNDRPACTSWTWVDAATAAANPTNYHFVRVQTHNRVDLYFLQVLVGSTSGDVAASAVAGRATETNMVQGLSPFAPFNIPKPDDSAGCTAQELAACARDANDPFGMVKGQWYTIRWLSGNLKDTDLPNFCPGDACPCMLKVANVSGAATAGYALYQGNDITQAIIGTPPLTTPVTVGSPIPTPGGQRADEMNALETRVEQDSDQTTTQYDSNYTQYLRNTDPKVGTDYRGNGRRVLISALQSAANAEAAKTTKDNTVVGFAGFMLGPKDSYRSGHMSTVGACAQYLGAFTIGVPGSGGSGNTVYTLRLYR